MRLLSKRIAAVLVGITAAAISSTALPAAAFAVPQQGSAREAIPTVAFMSPDEYADFYQAKFGKAAPANAATSGYTGLVRSESGEVIDTRGGVTALPGEAAGAGSDTSAIAFDPTPGGHWYDQLWSDTDKKGRTIPTRFGDANLGYTHYAGPHNLTTSAPFRVIRNTTNAYIEQGAHVEYRALLTNLSNGSIVITVRIAAQAATRTDDGKYSTPDGKYIGTITAYCEGVTLCPSWVNQISG